MMTNPTYSTTQAAAMTGASFRQLDYWSRTGMTPAVEARGSGTKREWTLPQVRALRVLTVLAALGATRTVLTEVYVTLCHMGEWPASVIVSAKGLVTVPGDGWQPSGWVVNLADADAYVDGRMAPLDLAG